jgi:hypothetical protein
MYYSQSSVSRAKRALSTGVCHIFVKLEFFLGKMNNAKQERELLSVSVYKFATKAHMYTISQREVV